MDILRCGRRYIREDLCGGVAEKLAMLRYVVWKTEGKDRFTSTWTSANA